MLEKYSLHVNTMAAYTEVQLVDLQRSLYTGKLSYM